MTTPPGLLRIDIELCRTLSISRIYCERGQSPGFQAFRQSHGRGLVPVFSSIMQLALARGRVDWFAVTGAELLAILPDEYDMLLDLAGPKPLWIKATGREGGAADGRTIGMRYRAAQHIRFADGTHQTSWASWTIGSLHRDIGQVTVEQMLPQSLGVRGVAATRQSYARTAFAIARIDPAALRSTRSTAIGIPVRIPGRGAWQTNLADPAGRPRTGHSAGRPVVAKCGSALRHIGPPSR